MVLAEAVPAAAAAPQPPIVQFPPEHPLTDELLMQISALNRQWQFERSAEGGLAVTFPAGGQSSEIEGELVTQLRLWRRTHLQGRVYGPSAGFHLPSGAVRSADASWVSAERLAGLSAAQLRGFVPVCPDFVIEVCSPSQQLAGRQTKMSEWLQNGVRLGLLLDPDAKLVFVYRPGRELEPLEQPAALSAEPELPGLVIDCNEIWALIGEDD